MPVSASIQFDDFKKAVKYMNAVEPGYKKLFTANVREIAKPVTDAMKSNYDDMRFPSGTKRNWQPKGRPVFPLTAVKSQKGVQVRVNTKNRGAGLSIYQGNAAAAVFDIAGKASSNKLGRAFDVTFGRKASRVMWPTFQRKEKDFIVEVQKVIQELVDETNKNFKVI